MVFWLPSRNAGVLRMHAIAASAQLYTAPFDLRDPPCPASLLIVPDGTQHLLFHGDGHGMQLAVSGASLLEPPDRTPVKIAIIVSPQLSRKLSLYTELYNALYPGDGEAVADLIPYMLESFLEADRNFTKALKERESKGEAHASPPQTNRRKRRVASNAPHASTEE